MIKLKNDIVNSYARGLLSEKHYSNLEALLSEYADVGVT